ncbi:MAG: methylated-DNA--[protein]-cysteine S-methyltransferase [Verrucomicrobiota bacterium]|jgi:methylated-DNA-[protein]-cysteine S-methyltransferase|nr:methylated-DNA--[protein]-cysteine S-methyltransferase [Verrucomicrobiota bacterium]
MRHQYIHPTPIGHLHLVEKDGKLVSARRTQEAGTLPAAAVVPSALLKQAVRQLDEYFAGTRKAFDLPLAPEGTAFQRMVWDALTRIPYGKTRSYGQIAAEVGRPKAVRAVGMANNRNPLPLFIPCHRVVGADGSLVGFALGLPAKARLLRAEHASA